MSNHVTLKEMVREAVEAHGGRVRFAQVKAYVKERHGEVNPTSLNCHFNMCSVNHQGRTNWIENQRPRICSERTKLDLLFKTGTGEAELFDPAKHGIWEIVRSEDPGIKSGWQVRRVDAVEAQQVVAMAPLAAGTSTPKETRPPSQPVTIEELGDLRRRIFRLLDQVEDRLDGETPGKRIGRLAFEGKIPRPVASMMQTIISFRNEAEYQNELPTPAESAVIRAGWVAVQEWAGRIGV